MALVERLQNINDSIAVAIAKSDAVTYIQNQPRVSPYALSYGRRLRQCWLRLKLFGCKWAQQCALFMGDLQRKDPPVNHRLILAALKAGDEPGLRVAVRADVTQGLRMLAR